MMGRSGARLLNNRYGIPRLHFGIGIGICVRVCMYVHVFVTFETQKLLKYNGWFAQRVVWYACYTLVQVPLCRNVNGRAQCVSPRVHVTRRDGCLKCVYCVVCWSKYWHITRGHTRCHVHRVGDAGAEVCNDFVGAARPHATQKEFLCVRVHRANGKGWAVFCCTARVHVHRRDARLKRAVGPHVTPHGFKCKLPLGCRRSYVAHRPRVQGNATCGRSVTDCPRYVPCNVCGTCVAKAHAHTRGQPCPAPRDGRHEVVLACVSQVRAVLFTQHPTHGVHKTIGTRHVVCKQVVLQHGRRFAHVLDGRRQEECGACAWVQGPAWARGAR